MSDGRFVRRVAELADCGILLGLHNLLTNERNGRDSLRAVFDEIPRERVWEIHLAGGMAYQGYWLDADSGPVEDELFDAARDVVDACPNLRAIVFEMMEQHMDAGSANAIRRDLRRMRRLWCERARSRPVARERGPEPERHAADPAAARRREYTLGALAIGRTPADPDTAIVADPAVTLYATLVTSMREGVLYELTPFRVRLLLACLGHSATMDLIDAYRASAAPQPFGGDDARGFIAYVSDQALDVPHLRQVVALEEALQGVQQTQDRRIVAFGCDPSLLLGTLAERRPPPPMESEDFEVVVSTAGLDIRRRGPHRRVRAHAAGVLCGCSVVPPL